MDFQESLILKYLKRYRIPYMLGILCVFSIYKEIEKAFGLLLDKSNVRLETIRNYGKNILEHNKKQI